MDVVCSIGKFLEYVRKKRGYTQEDVCDGICNRSYLNNIESGNREGNVTVIRALMERLGISSKRVVFLVDEKEERIFQKRDVIGEAIMAGDIETAKTALNEF